VAATTPPSGPAASDDDDPRLAQMIDRIERMAAGGKGDRSASDPTGAAAARTSRTTGASRPADRGPIADAFVPLIRKSLAEMHLTEVEVESLILKYLLARGDGLGRDIAEQLKVPFPLLDDLLRRMKAEQLVVYRSSNELHDYCYQLTELGRERARRCTAQCTYFGALPVSLGDYVESVRRQSLTLQRPTPSDLELAFQDILLSRRMLDRLGPAVNSGRGMFLYGSPGNGKSSIAKRISQVFGKYIWLPRAIGVDGEVIRVFDPHNHMEAPLPTSGGILDESMIDQRWVRVERPTILVGGELTMAQLDVAQNLETHICEAPLQMKSNCGTLVIDDFGRQRMRIDELLNRWIVPLEERVDFLNLPSGKTIQVPFDQLIVFSTNLEPRDLVDEAFLRRIAYKIEVVDPTEPEMRQLFRRVAEQMGMEYREDVVDDLLERHYRAAERPYRCCHPWDLLTQIRAYCTYRGVPLEMRREHFDFAVENYFAVM